MKRIGLPFAALLLLSFFIACNKTDIEIPGTDPGMVYRQLSDSELVLKGQLAGAAKIIAGIAYDQNVLDEIVTAIRAQPQIMSDRVKFADLIDPEADPVPGSSSTVRFSGSFKTKLAASGMKNASTLIDDLIRKDIELYIPYPVDDYPAGTDIIVTSNPLDNDFVNIGWFISDPETAIKVNEAMTDSFPVIIVNTPLCSQEELKVMALQRERMDAQIEEYRELISKNGNGNDVTDDAPASRNNAMFPPTADWYNESRHYGIYIPKIFCINDYVDGLFARPGTFVITGGTVSFDMDTKAVLSGVNAGTITFLLDKKYEKYANNGWLLGWYSCNFFIWQDWQPAITENALTMYIDLPSLSAANTFSLTTTWKQTWAATLQAFKLDNENGVSATSTSAITTTRQDHLYFSMNWLRERYKYDYSIPGAVWGEDGERTVPVENTGYRPALAYSNEVYFVTYCQWW